MVHLLSGVLLLCQLHTHTRSTHDNQRQALAMETTGNCQSYANLFYLSQPASNVETISNLKVVACLFTGALLPCQSHANMTTSLKHQTWKQWATCPSPLPVTHTHDNQSQTSNKGHGPSSHWCPSPLPIARKSTHDNQCRASNIKTMGNMINI